MSFSEIADQRILTSVKGLLGELTWDVAPDGYQRVTLPPAVDVDMILTVLLRRGLDPQITSLLLDRFVNRPIERALIAWDIAMGSLLGRGDAALAERLAHEIAPLKPIGAGGVAVNRDRISALTDAVSAAGEHAMPEGNDVPSLASAIALTANDTAGVEAILAFVSKLDRAHLPSLALAFVQILWTRLGSPEALDRLVELALDHDRMESLPVLPEDGVRAVQRQRYFGVRVSLLQLDTGSAMRVIDALANHPALANAPDPGLTVAKAELVMLDDETLEYEVREALDALEDAHPTWRYAARVRDAAKIQKRPDDAPIWLESFLTSFGNDMRMWAAAAYRDAARAELLAIVSRELRYQPHDPDAWRALAAFVEEGLPIEMELQQRVAAQLAAALG